MLVQKSDEETADWILQYSLFRKQTIKRLRLLFGHHGVPCPVSVNLVEATRRSRITNKCPHGPDPRGGCRSYPMTSVIAIAGDRSKERDLQPKRHNR